MRPADLLDELEAHSQLLGVTHFGVNMPSLEEVFLNCTAQSSSQQPQLQAAVASPSGSGPQQLPRQSEPAALELQPVTSAARGRPAQQAQQQLRLVSSDPDLPSKSPPSDSDLVPGGAGQMQDIQLGVEHKPAGGSSTAPAGGPRPTGLRHRLLAAVGAAWGWVCSLRPVRLVAHWVTAFTQMLRKRALTAWRDAALCWTLLLPVGIMALVLLILKVNVDPSAPTQALTLADIGQVTPLATAHAPASLRACQPSLAQGSAPALLDGAWSASARPAFDGMHCSAGNCSGRAAVWERAGVNDSYVMSRALLADMRSGVPAQYGAAVFSDPIVMEIPEAIADVVCELGLNVDVLASYSSQLPALAAQLAAESAGHAGGGAGGQAAIMAAAAFASFSAEARVLRAMVHRFETHPPVLLMHNGSSAHSLPALVSELHNSLAAVSSSRPVGAPPRLRVRSHPLPLTHAESVQLDNVLLVLAAVLLLVPW